MSRCKASDRVLAMGLELIELVDGEKFDALRPSKPEAFTGVVGANMNATCCDFVFNCVELRVQ